MKETEDLAQLASIDPGWPQLGPICLNLPQIAIGFLRHLFEGKVFRNYQKGTHCEKRRGKTKT